MPKSLHQALNLSQGNMASIDLLIDQAWYFERYPDVQTAFETAAAHYMSVGWAEGRAPNALFDSEWYLSQNPDVELSGLNPLVHYHEHGWREGRNPHPDFDTKYYLETNPDVAEQGINPLMHYFKHGYREGRRPAPSPVSPVVQSSGGEGASKVQSSLTISTAPLSDQAAEKTPAPRQRLCFFDPTDGLTNEQIVALIRDRVVEPTTTPQVTVIIPVYKNLRFTLRCVLSTLLSTDKTPREVVIVDDQSPDNSGIWLQQRLASAPGISVSVNPKNLGFLRSCNSAAEKVSTPYLFLLNNDTFVMDGWLDELVEVFKRHPRCGLTGSKLLYPDGSLQEAGGIIWKDASGANFGRNQDAWKPEFNYQRDVDYISAAAIMTPTRVWRELGGFSEEFAPAYYEDTDYAMKVRTNGMRAIYQPLSQVIHFEGISSGTDITKGVKRYQAVNKETFQAKWKVELQRAGEPADFAKPIVDRRPRGRILVYDAETPRPDKDSGSVTAFHCMRLLSELGMRVTFVPQNLLWANKHSRALQRIGVEMIFSPYAVNARQYVLDNADKFDIIMLSRAPVGGELINDLRSKYPNKPIIFDTVDVHHLRMFRQYDLEQDWSLWEQAARMKELELNAIRKSDVTMLVSRAEVKYLNDEIGPFPHVILPLIYEPYEPRNRFNERKDFAFVGGFRHTPNVDAIEHLVNDIWPLFRQRNTGAKLHIVGSHMPKDFARFACEDIVPVGYVEHLEPFMENIRVSVAPLRYGAGVKGKVGNSIRMGVPVVGTPVAVEGMDLTPHVHVKVGRTADEFAAAMTELYHDEAKWTRLAEAGRQQVMKMFGVDAARKTLSLVMNSLLN
jgi:GT2 family glycosyltransferase